MVLTATSGTGATVSKLFNGTTEIAKGTGGANWTVSNGTLTIKKAYLENLDEGTHNIRVVFNKDNECIVTITVEDTTA